jgi:hypothetical protein
LKKGRNLLILYLWKINQTINIPKDASAGNAKDRELAVIARSIAAGIMRFAGRSAS